MPEGISLMPKGLAKHTKPGKVTSLQPVTISGKTKGYAQ